MFDGTAEGGTVDIGGGTERSSAEVLSFDKKIMIFTLTFSLNVEWFFKSHPKIKGKNNSRIIFFKSLLRLLQLHLLRRLYPIDVS